MEEGARYVAARLWVSCSTKAGTTLCVTGSDAVLGSWDLAFSKPLHTSARCFPHWVSDILLFEAPEEGEGPREVAFKFALLRPSAADETEEDSCELEDLDGRSRSLLISPGAVGVLLEPAQPFVFGVRTEAPFDLQFVEDHGEGVNGSSGGVVRYSLLRPSSCWLGVCSRVRLGARPRGCWAALRGGFRGAPQEERPPGLAASGSKPISRGPSMMALVQAGGASEDAEEGGLGLYAVPSLYEAVRPRGVTALRSDGEAEAVAAEDLQGMDRQESVQRAVSDGTLRVAADNGGCGFRRSAARFCIVRFWASCETAQAGEQLVVVGDDIAIGGWDPERGVPLRTSVQLFPRWISENVLIEVPIRGAESREIQYKLALVDSASRGSVVRFEPINGNRSLVLPRHAAGRILEPSLPADFGIVGDGGGDFASPLCDESPDLGQMLETAMPVGRSSSAADLAGLHGSRCSGGFSRPRASGRGDSMQHLALEPVTP